MDKRLRFILGLALIIEIGLALYQPGSSLTTWFGFALIVVGLIIHWLTPHHLGD